MPGDVIPVTNGKGQEEYRARCFDCGWMGAQRVFRSSALEELGAHSRACKMPGARSNPWGK